MERHRAVAVRQEASASVTILNKMAQIKPPAPTMPAVLALAVVPKVFGADANLSCRKLVVRKCIGRDVRMVEKDAI